MDISPEGSQYVQRYHVHSFPHISIIDPRTARLMWSKEGWTQENPVTAESFAEQAMDFCSRNSFDRPPQAPRPGGSKTPPGGPRHKPLHELSEDEQLQAAMRASMEDVTKMDHSDDDDVEYLGATKAEEDTKPAPPPSVIDELLQVSVPDEPAKGPRIAFRTPDGKKVVRRFNPTDSIKMIYAFLAVRFYCCVCDNVVGWVSLILFFVSFQQSIEEAKAGREFVLKAGYPPKDLTWEDGDKTVEECQLSGQAVNMRWKD